MIAVHAAVIPSSSLPPSELLVKIARWLPTGEVELAARLALGAMSAAMAWAIMRALAFSLVGGALAGAFAACLLMGSPAWWGASLGPAIATAAMLFALTAARRLAGGGAAHDAAHDAVAAALGVVIAVLFEPGFAGLAVPVAALWWLRVGKRSPLGRGARTAAGRAQLVGLYVAPALALGALAVAALRFPTSEALLWPGWSAGGAPLPAAMASAAGVARVLAELLGPTAVVAAAAGALALLLPSRRLLPAAQATASAAPLAALVGAASGAHSGMHAIVVASSGPHSAPALAPSLSTSASAALDAPPGPWTFALLLAMAAGGALFDVQRAAIGVPSAAAIALAAGVAIQRLSAMAVVTMAPSAAPAGAPAGAMSMEGAPPSALTAGAIFVALTAGFLVLAPSLL